MKVTIFYFLCSILKLLIRFIDWTVRLYKGVMAAENEKRTNSLI